MTLMSTYLPDDLQAALQKFIVEKYPGLNRSEAITIIVRQWLVQHGYLHAMPEEGTRPEQLNSTNDD